MENNKKIANKIVGDTWRSKQPLTGKTITDLITEALDTKDAVIAELRAERTALIKAEEQWAQNYGELEARLAAALKVVDAVKNHVCSDMLSSGQDLIDALKTFEVPNGSR